MNGYKMLTIEAKDCNMSAMILIIMFYDSMVIYKALERLLGWI